MALRDFIDSYLECALWSSIDEEGDALISTYCISDIDPTTVKAMKEDCKKFYVENKLLWEDAHNYGDEQAGHDFWLTRNRHGAGFWDRGLLNGTTLTDYAQIYGDFDLYIGDDNRVYGG